MPIIPGTGRRAAAFAVVGAVCFVGAVLAWQALYDPAVPFLAERAPAAWILYPSPPDTRTKPAAMLDTVFRKELTLAEPPRKATLRVRWFRAGAVRVNGVLAGQSSPQGSWKAPTVLDVAALLRPGTNWIEARVSNATGPPALWLMLDADDATLVSDASWEASLVGAVARPARLARSPMDPPRSAYSAAGEASQPAPLASLRAALPLFLVYALLTLGVLGFRGRFASRDGRLEGDDSGGLSRRETVILFAVVALAWSLLCWNNRHLSPQWGFDVDGHRQYIRIVLEEHRLPLADEGWETYQPPLYYLLAAGALAATGHSRLNDPGSVEVLHGLGWAIGLLQYGALLASLRLLFRDRRLPVVVGFLLGAFLPAQLYLCQYTTNESLNAAITSVALFLALRILQKETVSPIEHGALGAVLGLAMLTKFSALIPLLVVGGVLLARLALLPAAERVARRPARALAALLAACLAACGWHYLRVAARFGTPIVGNWNAATGYAWWQDPGYRTAGELVRFGRTLSAPLFSAFWSLPDAIYSTLWGDGMLGGAAILTVRPPWNYGWMAAGYLLALPLTVMLLLGLGRAVVVLLRAPGARDFLLLGVLGGIAFGVAALTLRLPFYAQTKAFYGLAALVPLCAAGATGCELVARRGRLARVLLFVLLGVWAANAYAALWIRGGGAGEPSREALAALDPEGLIERSTAAGDKGDFALAVSLARRATELQPDESAAWRRLGASLEGAGADGEAVAAFREALRVSPADAGVHRRLADLYARAGVPELARRHAEYAERFDPATR